jgi:YHS domain-containing protein
MKSNNIKKISFFAALMIVMVVYYGCKKQPKCGCGKDMIFELTDAQVLVQYIPSSSTIVFYPSTGSGSTYYFCNPSQWMDTLKTMNTQEYLLLSGKVYYECNYLMSSGNSYYRMPPVYQVDVTAIKEDNYSKK